MSDGIDPIHQFCHEANTTPLTIDSDEYAALRKSLNGSDDGMDVFPFDLSSYRKIKIDPFTSVSGSGSESLTPEQITDIQHNIDLCRDIIMFFTSCGSASGYGGHTGGAFDTVPEVVLFDAFFRACPDRFVPVFYDEAGHRVATQYLMAALDGYIAPEFLRFYRKGYSCLPGHPELGATPGIQFSSGRLGHMWGTVNGIAMANPDRIVLMLGSDGSQMEGNDAEAARLAVAQNLNVKLVLDDNDVTITGHPSNYLKGYNLERTLEGHGLKAVEVVNGEDIANLYAKCRTILNCDGPAAIVCKRKMAPGVAGIEGKSGGHDALAPKDTIPFLESRGHTKAAAYLRLTTVKTKDPKSSYRSTGSWDAMRKCVGKSVVALLSEMEEKDRKSNIMLIDSDLAGSTGFNLVQKAHPEVYVQSGVMERGNFAAAAGFGMHPDKQGVFSTFAAFLEMLCSEITMARLNRSNVFCHFSHSGVDDMADNSCHFGLNNMFADNGLEDGFDTMLYFPCDVHQADAVVRRTFPLKTDDGKVLNRGLRFVFTTRSSTPAILGIGSNPTPHYADPSYEFVPGKDEILREGTDGYVVAFGDAVYRCLDAVETLKADLGVNIGLINKPTINVADPDMMNMLAACPLVLVVEPLSKKTGLGSKFGTWLLEADCRRDGTMTTMPKFDRINTHHDGSGGLWEQAYHQGYDSESIQVKLKAMLK